MHQLLATPQTVTWGYYDATATPHLRIKSGEVVQMQTLVACTPALLEEAGLPPAQVQPELRAITQQVTDKGPGIHILTGPVYVEGAMPGDMLEVRIQEVKLAVPYAYNAFTPGHGALPDDFPYARMRIVPLDLKRQVAQFAPGIEVPLRPFFGSMGVAPPMFRAASARTRPGFMPATLTTRKWWRALPSLFRCTCRAPCFRRVTGTRRRAMGK
ncbi:acetamidase/formamidase family protein [Hymenobacter sp. BRD128]|uniref:acetamidase/formamidase family protein n=1 Tax=Hymenobacter sp. BRD128 TaxID=2675878 RepID=UPI001C262B2A|nr:acetamidase/formamidase family protein [Hymenobacter sp. BRD128]